MSGHAIKAALDVAMGQLKVLAENQLKFSETFTAWKRANDEFFASMKVLIEEIEKEHGR